MKVNVNLSKKTKKKKYGRDGGMWHYNVWDIELLLLESAFNEYGRGL